MRARAAGGPTCSREHYEASLALDEAAIEIEPSHASALPHCAHCRIGIAFAWPDPGIAERIVRAEAEALRALDPNDAMSNATRDGCLEHPGRTDAARDALRQAIALSPRDPQGWLQLDRIGTVEPLAGHAVGAPPWLEQSYAVRRYWGTAMSLLAALSSLGLVAACKACATTG